jgi:hypothetical protein
LLASILVALGWLVLVPEPVWAWGPATHVALGEALLASLYLLPPTIRALLERYPIHFLYGSVAADISFAKKYAPEGRHCHHWPVGEEILASATTDQLRSTSLGYLAHLAADTIAHNFFVPRQLLLTSTTQALGHTYWEHRMDMHVGEEYMGKARRLVIDYDHTEADELFDLVLSRTLFSFQTNRQIFRGMIRIQDSERWKQVFDRVLKSSRFDLPDHAVASYAALSFDFIVEYFKVRERSRAAALDPVGDLNLRLAKKVRRVAMADAGETTSGQLQEMADEFFPLPADPLRYWPSSDHDVPWAVHSRPPAGALSSGPEPESGGGVLASDQPVQPSAS